MCITKKRRTTAMIPNNINIATSTYVFTGNSAMTAKSNDEI